MTIRKKLLVLLVLAAAVPVVVFGLLSYRAAAESLETAVTELHTRSALAEAEFAASYVLSLAGEISAVLQHDDPAQLSAIEVQEFLTRVFLRRSRISISALMGKGGEMHATVFVDDPEAFAQEPQFRLHDAIAAEEVEDFQERARALLKACAPGQAYAVSEPYFTRVRKKPAVVVLAPAPANHRLSLATELTLDELAARLASSYTHGTRAFLLNREGRLIVDLDPRRQALQESYLERLPRAKGDAKPGIAQYGDGGVTYLAAYSPVRELKWVAVVARPRDEALAPLKTLFRSAMVVITFALLFVAALAPLGARALAQPIAELAKGAVEYGRGNFAYRIGLRRKDELGDLARTFNEMGQSLDEANRKLVRFNEELQQQVDERTRELKLAQQQLLRSQRLAAVGDLSAGLAHEVNNPLAVIVGNVQLLLSETNEESPNRPMLSDVLDQALRISNIVKDLQALSEGQRAGKFPVDLRAVVQRAITAKGEDLNSSGIQISTRFDDNAIQVLGDEPALREVFGHLLSNSLNALRGRRDRNISLATSSIDGQAVVVEVTDTGRGIPKENLERIFNPFFTTKQSWAGKGLALAICHRIIENHGGKISIQSEENVGTTVTVVLPAAPPKPHLR